MRKRTLSMALIFVLVFSLETSAQATTISVQWVNTSSTLTMLSFDGNTAVCQTAITGKSGTSKISAYVVLYVMDSSGNYIQSASWSTTVYQTYLDFCQYAYNRTSGSTYMLYVTATVYNASGVGERVTSSSTSTCP